MNKKLDEKLKKIIESLSIRKKILTNITDESDLLNNLGFDSLSIIHLIARIEEEFNIEFSNEELVFENFRSYADVRNLVESKKCY
ncbi:acyl carrier protein [Paenibacillus macerans]|uniref:Phosphopantetheine attachment site family protein n=1 Tax=Paenibacillus macerans TaxID=44252 RepID=A0A091A4R0_PAEMA|nr:phosphopantetheine-binding protein [Paenibacillus macerans]KFN11286.1 phosphopantetheine attachment site family protein [Paenibacillus macerans]MCY7560218.1 phosphopantetheine-binding protein [Paenibacillus macerans]MEC0151272.1 phosphopantetheine-binding protein [Paenibacillus macerans]SUD26825.1 Acyl carrier protein [Paenibacillus macerans]